jgi:hypothetical protein
MWCHVVRHVGTTVSEATGSFATWYISTRLHGVTSEKTVILILRREEPAFKAARARTALLITVLYIYIYIGRNSNPMRSCYMNRKYNNATCRSRCLGGKEKLCVILLRRFRSKSLKCSRRMSGPASLIMFPMCSVGEEAVGATWHETFRSLSWQRRNRMKNAKMCGCILSGWK